VSRPQPTPLEQKIAKRIEDWGSISVAEFMASALYDEQEGYYVTGKPIGSRGDFTTAPEISQIFGELIGLWIAQSWLDLGAPSPFQLVELGPGQGTLMADVLRVGAKVSGFLAAVQVHFVESNKNLRKQQKEKLSQFQPRWHNNLGDVPLGATLLFANEFLDCLPIQQFVHADDGWREKMVGIDRDSRLCFGLGPLLRSPPQNATVEDDVGAVREASYTLPYIIEQLKTLYDNRIGRALFIDYTDVSGGAGDTLQAIKGHQKTHPLDHVGQSDLTAHVDFARLIRLAKQANLDTQGPITQRDFLLSLGIEARMSALIAANPHCANDVQQAVERLIGEAHMGALFCVVCLDSSLNEGRGPPLGF
jgi:NADH dehydrogenase [ubiquinone] 1 alpha subcomplex assembly factor 7